jgi:Zn-dependent protease
MLLNTRDSGLSGFVHLAQVLIIVNVILAVFNLFSIPPLDGFSVLRSVLPKSVIIKWLEQHGNLLFLIFFLTAGRIFGPIISGVHAWLSWLGAS